MVVLPVSDRNISLIGFSLEGGGGKVYFWEVLFTRSTINIGSLFKISLKFMLLFSYTVLYFLLSMTKQPMHWYSSQHFPSFPISTYWGKFLLTEKNVRQCKIIMGKKAIFFFRLPKRNFFFLKQNVVWNISSYLFWNTSFLRDFKHLDKNSDVMS